MDTGEDKEYNVEEEKAQRAALIEKIIENNEANIPEELLDKHERLLKKIFIEGEAPYKAMGFSDDMIEGLYGQVFRLYKSGKLDEAISFFKWLISLKPSDARFSFGLGACYHLKKNWDAAIDAYMLSAYTDFFTPLPFYHVADCYLNKGEPECALVALAQMKDRTGFFNHEFDPLLNKAEMMEKGIKRQIEEQEAMSQEVNKLMGDINSFLSGFSLDGDTDEKEEKKGIE